MTPPSIKFTDSLGDDSLVSLKNILEVDDLSSTLEKVAVDKIIVDHRVQRARLNKAKINNMVGNFFAAALGVIVLSRRANGSYVALDGWHRTEVCKLVPEAPAEVDARVFTGLTLAQEAKLFRLYNNRSSMHVVDLFNAEAIEGSERARKIIEIVELHGARVSTDSFAAVQTALRIVERPNGYRLLSAALAVISGAWTTADKRSLNGYIVEGLTIFLEYYGDERVDLAWLTNNLKKLGANGAKEIMDTASPYHKANGGRLAAAVCDVIVKEYNKGKREVSRLPKYQPK